MRYVYILRTTSEGLAHTEYFVVKYMDQVPVLYVLLQSTDGSSSSIYGTRSSTRYQYFVPPSVGLIFQHFVLLAGVPAIHVGIELRRHQDLKEGVEDYQY